MRINAIVIGSVVSSRIVLEELIRAGIPVLKVFSLDEQYSGNVSGYEPIHKTAEQHGIPASTFQKINDPACVEELERLSADYIFVVGLSPPDRAAQVPRPGGDGLAGPPGRDGRKMHAFFHRRGHGFRPHPGAGALPDRGRGLRLRHRK